MTCTRAPQHHGSRTADPRCLPHWASELTSLSYAHVVKQQREIRFTPLMCAACAQRLYHNVSALDAGCLSDALLANMANSTVACTCFSSLLMPDESGGLRMALERRGPSITQQPPNKISLLLLDAEGHTLQLLQQFPFSSTPIIRVGYAPYHMHAGTRRKAVALLERANFTHVRTNWRHSDWARAPRHSG